MTRKIEEHELTAYALGELDEDRAAEIERELLQNESMRAYVEEIRETAALLAAELGREPPLDLGEERIAKIDRPRRRKPRWALRAAIASAAALAAAATFVVRKNEPAMVFTSAEPIRIEGDDGPRSVEKESGKKASRESEGGAYASIDGSDSNAFSGVQGIDLGETGEPVPVTIPQSSITRMSGGEGKMGKGEYFATELRASAHDKIDENPFLGVRENPLSTFSIDVDTASYALLRRYLQMGRMPPKDAVRIEEMINYFDYDLPAPQGDPIAIHVDVTDAPWRADHLLARVALKAAEVSERERPAANLVFLIDVSGSMSPPDRLPLLVQGLHMLVDSLRGEDRVAIVVYAGAAGVVIPSTPGERKNEIRGALDRLQAGGSTNGGAGIKMAYRIAQEHFIDGGINRVILATDGDFNVGVTSHDELIALIKKKAKSGVFLTVLGFGIGNYNDASLEQLADKGNGNYAYIDSAAEAKKVLVDQVGGTLHAIAKDVKIQIELNPARVSSYRLLGYENRSLRAEEFNDDRVDAGEIGAGHTVTALYELVPAGVERPPVDPLKYQESALSAAAQSGDLFTIKLRYKEPDGDESRLIERAVHESQGHYRNGSADLKFAAAVAGFGMMLRQSPHRGNTTYALLRELAQAGIGRDPNGHRTELLSLVLAAERIVAPQPEARATGFLNVGAKPWANITIDGVRWPHPTPQAGIELSAGKHKITLHNPETGVTKVHTVVIKAGAYQTINADMRAR